MSTIAMKVAHMVDMLPLKRQNLVLRFVKLIMLTWDPDYTRLTADEAKMLKKAEAGEFVNESEIDWNNLKEQFGE